MTQGHSKLTSPRSLPPAVSGNRGWPRGTGVIALVLGFVLVTVGAGGALGMRQRNEARKSAFGFIEATAKFRAAELGRWLAERYGDAQVAGRDSVIAGAAAVPPAARVSTPTFVAAGRRLEIIARTYGYEAAAVLDLAGHQVLAVGVPIDVDSAELRTIAARAIASQRVQLSRLVWSSERSPDELKLDVVAPLLLEKDGADAPTVAGSLVLRIDVREIIATVLAISPAASATGTLVLLAPSGARTIAVHPRRRSAGQDWIVAAAEAPILTGAAHAGEQVSATTPVAGVPWTVHGQMAVAEISGPVLRSLWLMCGLVATSLLGLSLLAYGLWKRRAQRDLRASEEKFRNIFENMQDGYLLSRPSGEILLVNPATVRILGYDGADELLGKNMARDVFENADDRVAMTDQLIASGTVRAHKATLKRKDGTRVIVEVNVRLICDHQGAPLAFEGVMRDMSSHYEIRNELIRAREAALGAAQAKAQFLANMSHEIRTPLNAIVGLGHLLARADLAPQQADYITNMQASVRMLLDVVNNVLDFSKIEAGRLTLESIPFRLDDVLAGVSNMLALPARDKGLDLVCSIDDQVPRWLRGDPVRLGQVLTNLADNGVKFTAQGQVAVAVELIDRQAERAVLHFVVRDTGIGIPADRALHMFEPFVQADGSTTRRFGGTGLGLSISHQLVDAMGGQLTVVSSPDAGSAFEFTIGFALAAPMSRSQTELAAVSSLAGAPPAPATAAALRGARILVAEDNVINQQVARELLEGVGAIVSMAASGRTAVDAVLAATVPFDAVLMDLQMPELDGFEATRAIRRDPRFAGLPIIAMTAHAFDQEKGKCLAAGMNDHVTKPVEPARLFETLARWMGTGGQPPRVHMPAIDVQAGLRRVGNNPAFYHRMLARFSGDWRDGAARLRQLVDDAALDDARRLVHTMKGTAATLGIDDLAADAGTVEQLLKGPPGEPAGAVPAGELAARLTVLLDRLASTLAGSCAAIDAVVGDTAGGGPPASGPPPAADGFVREPTLAAISELESLLGRRNLRAREAVGRLQRAALPENCREPLQRIVGKVDKLDYAGAAAALAQLKALLHQPQESSL